MAEKPTYEELEKRVRDCESRLNVPISSDRESTPLHSRTFQVLYDLTTAVTSNQGLNENLRLVVEKSRALFPADVSFIALRDELAEDMFLHSFAGVKTEAFKNMRFPFKQGLSKPPRETGKGWIIDDCVANKELTKLFHRIIHEEGLVSGIMVPIQMGQKDLGLLCLFNRTKTLFSRSDLDALFLFGNIAAIEISRIHAQEARLKADNDIERQLAERTANILESNNLLRDEIAERKQTLKTLRERQAWFRGLLDFAPYPIVVFTLDGLVYYLNPAFTEVFGWSLPELEGKRIPYVPLGLEKEVTESIKQLFEKKAILRYETRRLAKDGRILDVVIRAAIFYDTKNEPAGELVILRDITREKRITQNNEAMLRISMALPQYPDLETLLDYITYEIKRLLKTEGGTVALLDEGRQEVFFLSAAYDDKITQKKIKEMRFSMEVIDQFIVSKVLRTGEPAIVRDTSKVAKSFAVRDRVLGYETRNFIQVPLKSSDRITGVLSAINKKEGVFDETDVEVLNMIAGTVALSIENARFSEELKQAYQEMAGLNRAKDKVFQHLSHELKTPVSVLSGSLKILAKKLAMLPEESWKPSIERAKRNLDRIVDIQAETEDIVHQREYRAHDTLSMMIDECADELETLIVEEVGEVPLIDRLRERIREIFATEEMVPEKIILSEFVKERLSSLQPLFSHRNVDILTSLETAPPIVIPREPLQKVFDGLVRNAVENTPDEGRIEIAVKKKGNASELEVRDFGVGITEENQRRIFEGFFPTQETMEYSSKRPFDFNAGGKGADLLRMRMFSERFDFKIDMFSTRCKCLEDPGDGCIGRISECPLCRDKEDCELSGGTTFRLQFHGEPQEPLQTKAHS